jgi:Alkylmercury lyase
VDPRALDVRNLTYAMFVERGRAPTAHEVAGAARLDDREVEQVWGELHRDHALVLNPVTGAILMAAPFSAVPTAFRVHAAGRGWYGNCAWDAVGICAALHADGRVETSCPDCGDSIILEVRRQKVQPDGLLFHCLVPAQHWWDDIVFT